VDALSAVNRATSTGAKGRSMQLYANSPSDPILRIGFWYDDIIIPDDTNIYILLLAVMNIVANMYRKIF